MKSVAAQGKQLKSLTSFINVPQLADPAAPKRVMNLVRRAVDPYMAIVSIYDLVTLLIVGLLGATALAYGAGLLWGTLGYWLGCCDRRNGSTCLSCGGVVFVVAFTVTMVASTIMLCLGIAGQRVGCDLIRDLHHPRLEPVIRFVVQVIQKKALAFLGLSKEAADRRSRVGAGDGLRQRKGEKEYWMGNGPTVKRDASIDYPGAFSWKWSANTERAKIDESGHEEPDFSWDWLVRGGVPTDKEKKVSGNYFSDRYGSNGKGDIRKIPGEQPGKISNKGRNNGFKAPSGRRKPHWQEDGRDNKLGDIFEERTYSSLEEDFTKPPRHSVIQRRPATGPVGWPGDFTEDRFGKDLDATPEDNGYDLPREDDAGDEDSEPLARGNPGRRADGKLKGAKEWIERLLTLAEPDTVVGIFKRLEKCEGDRPFPLYGLLGPELVKKAFTRLGEDVSKYSWMLEDGALPELKSVGDFGKYADDFADDLVPANLEADLSAVPALDFSKLNISGYKTTVSALQRIYTRVGSWKRCPLYVLLECHIFCP